jgi:hypothetical protein
MLVVDCWGKSVQIAMEQLKRVPKNGFKWTARANWAWGSEFVCAIVRRTWRIIWAREMKGVRKAKANKWKAGRKWAKWESIWRGGGGGELEEEEMFTAEAEGD